MRLKKLLAALGILLVSGFPATAASNAQFLLRFHMAYDRDAVAYFAALVSNGCTTPSAAFKGAVNTYITAEKAARNWGGQSYAYITTTADFCTASVNLAQPALYKATITNTCTLSVASGMQGNSIDCRLDPNVADTSLIRFSQNTAHILVCVGGAGGSNTVGQVSGTMHNRMSTITNKNTRLNSGVDVVDTGGGQAGCHYADRSSSSALTTGKNGAIQSNAVANTSAALTGVDIALCETVAAFCTSSLHLYYYEMGLPIPDEATHYTNIHNLIVALGAVGAP